MTKLIGKACLCSHDVLDHYPEGCLRCRDYSPVLARFGQWRHRFMPRAVS